MYGCGSVHPGWVCGKSKGGYVQLCPTCRGWAEKCYPQGWTCYPGDTCKHGHSRLNTCYKCEGDEEEV